MSGSEAAAMRIIALSATIPNIDDVGAWLHVPEEYRFRFGDECRPVKVRRHANGAGFVIVFCYSISFPFHCLFAFMCCL
jgi:replicative superfamily II helicase